MRKTLAALLLAVTAVVSSTALAMAPKKAVKKADADPVLTAKDDCRLQRARDPNKVCELEFAGDEVETDVEGPPGDLLKGRKLVEHPTLIRYRADFVDRILGSAEQR